MEPALCLAKKLRIMKKIVSQWIIALVALVASVGTFASCDSFIASDLEGTWEGDMYFASYYDGDWYYSNYSQIEFVGDPTRMKSGRGYWVDYYSGAPWDYVANHFSWRVQDRCIYIHLMEDNYDLQISDYSLTTSRFHGYVYYDGEEREFDLVHTSSPNWDDYDYGYGYYGGGYYGGYYSQRRSRSLSDSTSVDGVKLDGLQMLKERPKRVLVKDPQK